MSAVLVAPFGMVGVADSAWELGPVVAVIVLGVVNTGAGTVLMVLFAGRVGPTRGGVAIYFLPSWPSCWA